MLQHRNQIQPPSRATLNQIQRGWSLTNNTGPGKTKPFFLGCVIPLCAQWGNTQPKENLFAGSCTPLIENRVYKT